MIFKKLINKIRYYKLRLTNELYFLNSKNALRKYKDKYLGQRCFIIGNGPSLKVEDLEKLKGEITFGSHGIYFIFNETSWRPTFYCAQDALLINQRISDINDKCKNTDILLGLVKNYSYPKLNKNTICVNLINEHFTDYPKFSTNAVDGVYEGMTVTYFNIQLAVYMGFKEIYLLGVDHFYSGDENDHFSKEDVCTNKPQTDKSTLAYIAAKKYADENGIKIYNSTRGGHLEVFARIDFDCVLE